MLINEQLATLRANIDAETDAGFVAAREAGNNGLMLEWYNAPASPTFYVYRPSVTADEIMQNGFDWVRVDNLSVGKARIWEWMFDNQSRAIDAGKGNVRAGIVECWKGTAADVAVRVAVFSHCQRAASRVEKLFATGNGTTISETGNGPGTLAVIGPISIDDIRAAVAL